MTEVYSFLTWCPKGSVPDQQTALLWAATPAPSFLWLCHLEHMTSQFTASNFIKPLETKGQQNCVWEYFRPDLEMTCIFSAYQRTDQTLVLCPPFTTGCLERLAVCLERRGKTGVDSSGFWSPVLCFFLNLGIPGSLYYLLPFQFILDSTSILTTSKPHQDLQKN